MNNILINLLIKTSKIKNYLLSSCIVLLVGFSNVAVASGSSSGSLKDIVGNVKTNVTSLISLLIIIAYVAGVGFALVAVLQFKAHKDNPQQMPLGKPVVALVVAACLLFLPSIMQTAGKTVFGDNAKDIGSGAVGSITIPTT